MIKRFKYPFTATGVAHWQTMLSGLTPVQREDEAICVEQLGLKAFLPYRFILEAAQVAFLDNLPQALCGLWTAQIAYAIREEIPIMLEKPESRLAMREEDGTKFIESNGRTRTPNPTANRSAEAGTVADAGQDEEFLRFTITH